MSMFEFDLAKSDANKAKHGIDFVDAQAIWLDDRSIEITSAQHHEGEERRLVIGMMRNRLWVAIVTHRAATIRIISVRRARDYEEAAYEQAQQDRG
jgi:hypothetical protein